MVHRCHHSRVICSVHLHTSCDRIVHHDEYLKDSKRRTKRKGKKGQRERENKSLLVSNVWHAFVYMILHTVYTVVFNIHREDYLRLQTGVLT